MRAGAARSGRALYAASVRTCGEDHIHAPTGPHLRRALGFEVLKEATGLYEAGGHSLGAIVRYMEMKHKLRINIRSMRRRIDAQREKCHPRATEAARLIQNLFDDQASDPSLRYQVEKTGLSHTLCNIWWAYPEWLRDCDKYGVVPNVRIDGKDIANRFDLLLFSISGRTNTGRVRLLAMAFSQGEIVSSVEWFLRCFKDAVGIVPKILTMDASYAIVSAARNVFSTARIILDAWNLDQNEKRNVPAFIRASRSMYTSPDMSKTCTGYATVRQQRHFFVGDVLLKLSTSVPKSPTRIRSFRTIWTGVWEMLLWETWRTQARYGDGQAVLTLQGSEADIKLRALSRRVMHYMKRALP